jgi:hypothetical protein
MRAMSMRSVLDVVLGSGSSHASIADCWFGQSSQDTASVMQRRQ